MTKEKIGFYRLLLENELFECVIPFWENHSIDEKNGGYYNCLDRDGSVYDTRKHIWLQGRQAWMFSKLFESDQKSQWLEIAYEGVKFLTNNAVREDGRVYFSLTEDGRPIYMQRKIFSECFYVMALAGYANASGESKYQKMAELQLAKIWDWSEDLTKVGRPVYEGEIAAQSLAIPMILLNLIEEVTHGDYSRYNAEVDRCIDRILLHVDRQRQVVFETVTPDGGYINNSDGRVLNPGHAIEAGWFLQNWAQKKQDAELAETAAKMVRWSYSKGWDKEYGGIFYFLDYEGYSPLQLEWDMKLWWPHCEAMVAHLQNVKLFGLKEDWDSFTEVTDYSFTHFSDKVFGEWYGYTNRRGEITHRFKGGPYKGCFHVPRALFYCWQMLGELEKTV